jgi:hypothetical protein
MMRRPVVVPSAARPRLDTSPPSFFLSVPAPTRQDPPPERSFGRLGIARAVPHHAAEQRHDEAPLPFVPVPSFPNRLPQRTAAAEDALMAQMDAVGGPPRSPPARDTSSEKLLHRLAAWPHTDEGDSAKGCRGAEEGRRGRTGAGETRRVSGPPDHRRAQTAHTAEQPLRLRRISKYFRRGRDRAGQRAAASAPRRPRGGQAARMVEAHPEGDWERGGATAR